MLAAVYRVVLEEIDSSVHLVGPTGVFKTEVAALGQQHFGAGMDARHLPASWSSTANALEAIAFAAKDAVFVVDDFSPTGSAADIARLHRDADRLLRAQGNRSGRSRMRADISVRAQRPPRGLVLSTGEDVPRGQSLRARILVVEVGPGDVDARALTACQADAATSRYAASLAGFVRWIAVRRDAILDGLRDEVVRLRAAAQASRAHRRTPEVVANLAIGIERFLEFAEDVGAITAQERTALSRRCWAALGEAAASQAEHQASGDPATRFLELLASAIAAGRAHVAGEDGGAPPEPGAWGWRRDEPDPDSFARERWRPARDRVGWLGEDGADLYLDPDASFAAAQSVGRDIGDVLTVQPRTLHKRCTRRASCARPSRLAVGSPSVVSSMGDAARFSIWMPPPCTERPNRPNRPARGPITLTMGRTRGPFRRGRKRERPTRPTPERPTRSTTGRTLGRMGRLGRSPEGQRRRSVATRARPYARRSVHRRDHRHSNRSASRRRAAWGDPG